MKDLDRELNIELHLIYMKNYVIQDYTFIGTYVNATLILKVTRAKSSQKHIIETIHIM